MPIYWPADAAFVLFLRLRQLSHVAIFASALSAFRRPELHSPLCVYCADAFILRFGCRRRFLIRRHFLRQISPMPAY